MYVYISVPPLSKLFTNAMTTETASMVHGVSPISPIVLLRQKRSPHVVLQMARERQSAVARQGDSPLLRLFPSPRLYLHSRQVLRCTEYPTLHA